MNKTKGLGKVIDAFNKKVRKLEEATLAGLVEAALFFKRESIPITPYDTGNLRQSGFVIWQGGGDSTARFKGKNAAEMKKDHKEVLAQRRRLLKERKNQIRVDIGYTANYAMYVHENPDAAHAAGTQWKFLQTVIDQQGDKALEYIKRRASQ